MLSSWKHKHARLVARILLAEDELVNVSGQVNQELDRRARLRGTLPKGQRVAAKY
jgi:hypothetical protein